MKLISQMLSSTSLMPSFWAGHDGWDVDLLAVGVPDGQPVSSGWYSRISPGWQSSSRQSDSSVENLTALALPVFRMDRLASVTPTRSDSSVRDMRRSRRTRSRVTRMAISVLRPPKSSSSLPRAAVRPHGTLAQG